VSVAPVMKRAAPKRARVDYGSRLLIEDFLDPELKLSKKQQQQFRKTNTPEGLLVLAEGVRRARETGRECLPRTHAKLKASVSMIEQPIDAEDEEMDAAAARATQRRPRCPTCRQPIGKRKVPIKRLPVDGGEVDTCAICFDTLGESCEMVLLSCGKHYLCTGCFDDLWEAC